VDWQAMVELFSMALSLYFYLAHLMTSQSQDEDYYCFQHFLSHHCHCLVSSMRFFSFWAVAKVAEQAVDFVCFLYFRFDFHGKTILSITLRLL
jgi:hypothetical protein